MDPARSLDLRLLADRLAVARLDAARAVPAWAFGGEGFVAVVRRGAELSVVCEAERVPRDVTAERGLRALELEGPLDFAATGILASVAVPLADAGIPIFALATYDTDVILVQDDDVDRATGALMAAGHRVSRAS